MTLIITATGQPAEVEEVHEAGYYCTVQGHSRFLPSEAVTHPAPLLPACPECSGPLFADYDPAFRATWLVCANGFDPFTNTHCAYQRRA